jgi:hypothetical protein
MKLENLGVIVKSDDGKVYQVALNKLEQSLVKNLIINLHRGSLKILDEPIDTIDICKNEGISKRNDSGAG